MDPAENSLGNVLATGGGEGERPSQATIQQVLSFLRRNGLTESEEVLSREAANVLNLGDQPGASQLGNISESLSTEFGMLLAQVDASCDVYRAEFALLLFPIFSHAFFTILNNDTPEKAQEFVVRYHLRIPRAFEEYVLEFARITSPALLRSSENAQTLIRTPFTVRLSRSCIKQLEPLLHRLPNVREIIKDHVVIEQADLVAKLTETVESQMGGLCGQLGRQERKHKVFYGLHRDDPSQIYDRRKMKDSRKKEMNAPLPDRIPLPPMSEAMRNERKNAAKEAQFMQIVSAESPPTVCLYTALNAADGVSSADLSDDSSILALGLGNSTINLFAIDETKKLKKLKTIEELEKLDQDADDLPDLLHDEKTASTSVVLHGHGGPVYSVNFSPDKRLLVSSSLDQTIRLWSVDAQRQVVVYRVGTPVYGVTFCQRGYYFASAHADGCAALWVTDRMNPLRIFTDALGEATCVDFHPNCNYVVAGSEDKYVRMWDVLSGTCVRTFSAHQQGIRGVKISPCGRYVVSMGGEGAVSVWDIAMHRCVAVENDLLAPGTSPTMASIAFSRDGSLFAVSPGTSMLHFFSLDTLIAPPQGQTHETTTYDPKFNATGGRLFSYATKQTPIVGLHFTRRNCVLAVGAYDQF